MQNNKSHRGAGIRVIKNMIIPFVIGGCAMFLYLQVETNKLQNQLLWMEYETTQREMKQEFNHIEQQLHREIEELHREVDDLRNYMHQKFPILHGMEHSDK